ncbi:hypothetical protein LLEC1_01663 [Akanthomyces lecanii]|uniref:Zn(2)-C6 fungal-type domain-containing protein n=1 Tax=Cordyceps confragosa TaxID=2714763 RepID=A0A179I2J0_CORDF|nr:hypothetical protein LLEC1_01663 [Akanthomyces lecanii]
MATICSLPLHSTAQSWQKADNRAPAPGSSQLLAAYSCSISSKTYSGYDSLQHKPQHQLPPNGSCGLDAASTLGYSSQKNSRQIEPSFDPNKSPPSGMTAKHGQPAPVIKRSYSTPAVHTMADSATTAGEKKRNKLGYHRTSIACSNDALGHCRRRKIRCIVSPEMQNRCINCIRLKKDCSFFPVDQQSGGDSQGKSTGQETGSSTAHSQSSSPILGPGHPAVMPSGSMYGTGPMQDAIGHAASTVGYASVAGEGLGIPTPADQNFVISSESSLAWGSAEPRPVAMPGSMDVGYGWRPYGSVSGSTEHISPFGPGPTTASNWMAATPGTPQLNDWTWDNGMPPTIPARSMSFSGELLGHPPPQLVPVPSNAPPYSTRGRPIIGNAFSSPITPAPGLHHLPSQAGDSSGTWGEQRQQMFHQPQPLQRNASFQSWGMPDVSGPPM